MDSKNRGDRAKKELPAVDDYLVEPDGGYEIVDGERVELAPAKEAHGEQHFDLPGVLLPALAPGYRGAVDMLTRTDKTTNIAPDVSIYPAERDPVTGGRMLEEIIFEVLDSQPLGAAQWRAERLMERGVRRAFAVDAAKKRLFEWNAEKQEWHEWSPDSLLEDRCFAAPIAVKALLDVTLADQTIVQALLAKKSAPLETAIEERERKALAKGTHRGILKGRQEGRIEGREEGRAQTLRTTILDLCEAYGITPTEAQREALSTMNSSELETLRTTIKTQREWRS